MGALPLRPMNRIHAKRPDLLPICAQVLEPVQIGSLQNATKELNNIETFKITGVFKNSKALHLRQIPFKL